GERIATQSRLYCSSETSKRHGSIEKIPKTRPSASRQKRPAVKDNPRVGMLLFFRCPTTYGTRRHARCFRPSQMRIATEIRECILRAIPKNDPILTANAVQGKFFYDLNRTSGGES